MGSPTSDRVSDIPVRMRLAKSVVAARESRPIRPGRRADEILSQGPCDGIPPIPWLTWSGLVASVESKRYSCCPRQPWSGSRCRHMTLTDRAVRPPCASTRRRPDGAGSTTPRRRSDDEFNTRDGMALARVPPRGSGRDYLG